MPDRSKVRPRDPNELGFRIIQEATGQVPKYDPREDEKPVDLTQKQGGIAIIRAIAALGASLQLATMAEGVETMEQLVIVSAEGCTEVQGFLFSPPRPAKDIAELLETTCGSRQACSRRELMLPSKPPAERFLADIPRHGNIFNGQAV